MSGIFLVSREFFCLKEPDAAFLAFANFSLIFLKSFFGINTSPRISISLGQFLDAIFFGMSLIVFKFSVISSPSLPLPLERPLMKIPFLYFNEADIPSFLGSVLYSISLYSFKLKKFNSYFSKFFKSFSSNTLDKESIGTLCLTLTKILEGLNPTCKEGDSFVIKSG